MSVLLINYIASLIFSIFTLFDRDIRKPIVLLIFVFVFFTHAFPDISSLEDLSVYSLGFDEIRNMTVWQCITTNVEVCKMERGFALILKLYSLLGLDFRAFLIVNSFLISALFYKSIMKYSPSIVLSSLLFLLIINNQSIYVIRQYLVVAIFFNAIKWIIDRKALKYFLTCLTCFFIHQSAIILFPLYFIYKLDHKKLLVCVALCGLAMYVFLSIILEFFTNSLIGYSSYAVFEGAEGQNITGLIISIVNLAIFLFLLKKEVYTPGINRIVYICLLFNIVILFAGIGFNFSSRLAKYFSSMTIFMIPIAVSHTKNKLIKATIVAAALLLFSMLAFNGAAFIEASKLKLSFF